MRGARRRIALGGLLATALLVTAPGCGGGGGGAQNITTPSPPPPPPEPATFPGELLVVDRAALYEPDRDELANGGFELDDVGVPRSWELVATQGSPSWELFERAEGGQALRVTHTRVAGAAELLVVTSEAVAVDDAVERYYLAFEVRTAFGFIDEGWTAAGTDERVTEQADVTVNGQLRWTFPNGTTLDVTVARASHSLNAWRPLLGSAPVPRGATEVQARFQIAGNVPNAVAAHVTELDAVRLFAEPPELAPQVVDGSAVEGPGDSVEFIGTTAAGDVRVTATFVPAFPGAEQDGELSGEVVGLAGRDLALDLVYSVDFDAVGGRIDRDVSRSESITTDVARYAETISADVYSDLGMAVVPLATVTDAAGETRGLALALDTPRVAEMVYDTERRRFELVHHLGLRASGARSRAAFRFYTLRTTSTWGYRDLWLRYTSSLEADAFQTERPSAGGTAAFYGALFDEVDGTPRVAEVGALIADFDVRWVVDAVGGGIAPDAAVFTQLETYDLELLLYDFPWALLDSATPANEPPPDYDALEARVGELQASPDVREAVRADHVLRDLRADLVVNRIADDLGPGGQWSVRYPVAASPQRSAYLDAVFDDSYTGVFAAGEQSPATTRQRVGGLNFDGFFKEARVVEVGSDGVGLAPLTYDPNTGRPGAHLAADHLDYLEAVRDRLDTEIGTSVTTTGNVTALGPALYALPTLDLAGWEARPELGVNFGHAELNARRMLMPGKVLGAIYNTDWCPVPDATLRRFVDTVALLGVYPSLFNGQDPPPCLVTQTVKRDSVSALLREALPVLDAMHAARWQVVPFATLTDAVTGEEPALRVERFGTFAPYYFAVLNNPSGLVGDPDARRRSAVLTLDLGALFLAADATASVAYGEVVLDGSELVDGDLEVRFELGPGEGAVLEVR